MDGINVYVRHYGTTHGLKHTSLVVESKQYQRMGYREDWALWTYSEGSTPGQFETISPVGLAPGQMLLLAMVRSNHTAEPGAQFTEDQWPSQPITCWVRDVDLSLIHI